MVAGDKKSSEQTSSHATAMNVFLHSQGRAAETAESKGLSLGISQSEGPGTLLCFSVFNSGAMIPVFRLILKSQGYLNKFSGSPIVVDLSVIARAQGLHLSLDEFCDSYELSWECPGKEGGFKRNAQKDVGIFISDITILDGKNGKALLLPVQTM